MSIQPNRVLARIVEQVDRSDWPVLESRVHCVHGGEALVRIYLEPRHERWATPLHFWVHALRDELAARGRRADLVDAAGRALCRTESIDAWRAELEGVPLPRAEGAGRMEIHRMLESTCRRSSVVDGGEWLMAHFWIHGSAASWRQEALG